MEQKIMGWKTKGMNQDLSVSAFNNEFSFENMNLRLSTNDGNTQMSWVNEKGTKLMTLDIENSLSISEEHDTSIGGIPIGTAILNHKLVLFTTMHPSKGWGKPDFIYVLEYSDSQQTTLKGKLLYNGNLNFNSNYPLETLVSYEAEHIQKVYWTDGFNQPRMINIAASDSKLKKWNSTTDGSVDTFFDFVPSFSNNEEVVITQNTTSGGIFAPGVIQYAFTYINKYGQESNLVYVSPLYYLSHYDRGASPEGVGADERVTSSFRIQIYQADKNFDYIRIYSIQRTSLNLEPTVKHLEDLPVSGTTVAELYSTSIVYNDSDGLTLPVDAKGKIYTKKTVNGRYIVTVSPAQGTTSYSPSSNFIFRGYLGDSQHRQEEDICTLQDLLTTLFLKDSGVNSFIKSYHAGFTITQDLLNKLDSDYFPPHNEYDYWEFLIDSNALFNSRTAHNYIGYSFIYNYEDQKWYFTNKEVVEQEIKNEQSGSNYIQYIDDGTGGSLKDPTELLYIGGHEITALTMADKDGTLFLGNIEQLHSDTSSLQKYFDSIRGDLEKHQEIEFKNDGARKRLFLNHATGVYSNTHQLNSSHREITTFKGGETYRFGFQLQKKTGEWSEPIFLSDEENGKYPSTSIYRDAVDLVYAETSLQADVISEQSGLGESFYTIYGKIRPVIVYPEIGDRKILCQGVLNPTVFNASDRKDNSPFAQASWYFRPYMAAQEPDEEAAISSIHDYTSVTFHTKTSSDDTTIDPFFSNSGQVQNIYVLVASLPPENIDRILTNRKLAYRYIYTIQYDNPSQDDNDPAIDESRDNAFLGAVRITQSTRFVIYAFISDSPWEYYNVDEYNESMQARVTQKTIYSDGLQDIKISSESYQLADPIQTTYNALLYYNKTAYTGDAPEQYVFKFCAGDTFYAVTFTNASQVADYIPNMADAGTELPFKHYESLAGSTSDVGPGNEQMVEIQGAFKQYESPFSRTLVSNEDISNTQFFVDQSIVTLNSPDIEFDTEVQGYSVEGLKLRVVGAIPITANASAHHITHTSMLNVGTTSQFGKGELQNNVIHSNVDIFAGKRLVSEYLWNDVVVTQDGSDADGKIKVKGLNPINYLIYPWHRSGSLNNDWRSASEASSVLKTKKESNILYSINSEYLPEGEFKNFSYIGTQMALTENDEVMNIRLPRQKSTVSDINYYANIDKVLYNKEYNIIYNGEYHPNNAPTASTPISMKYKSTSHAVLALRSIDNLEIPILPGIEDSEVGQYINPVGSSETFWGDKAMQFKQEYVDMNTMFKLNDESYSYNFLWLGELYKDVLVPFGGTSREAVLSNKWLPAGDAITIAPGKTITLQWTEGDTYYQRYDCLKTYAFTPEDTNQIVEILSFMCETHVNIDGRYDRNRGQIDNTDMHPTIFNLLNPVYSQKDNFFTSRQLDMEDVKELKYPNQIYYTKTKNSGADVDMWTNVTLANTLELDGDKGKISSLNRFNDAIIAFQDTGISQVLYNENTQISTTQGVPIEIANSGKVQGKRYLSDTIGCSNKWSISQTPAGLYFMDNHSKGIYLFNGQLQNLSLTGGFNAWCKQNIPLPGTLWSPRSFNDFTSHYDKKNQEVLFVNGNTALAYSEKFGAFTSFYSYENTPYFCNLDDTGLFIMFNDYKVPYGSGMHRKFRNLSMSTIWQHQTGEYCKFFNSDAPYWMTLVGNPEPQRDKVFTNLEFRATVDGDGKEVVTGSQQTKTGFEFYLPFDSLEVWNEYQHGVTALKNMKGHAAMMHHTPDKESSLKRKYRIWRCDVPRDNAPLTSDEGKNISRFKVKPLDRMRNPWVYLKLQKDATSTDSSLPRVEIHDMMMKYFV